jgi:hypothetical protein
MSSREEDVRPQDGAMTPEEFRAVMDAGEPVEIAEAAWIDASSSAMRASRGYRGYCQAGEGS